jgi:hypothetical protein
MRWERELGDALRELSRADGDVPSNAAAERRLLEAFDARGKHGGLPHKALRAGDLRGAGLRAGGSLWALAAAASLVLAAGIWWSASMWPWGKADPAGAPSHQAGVAPQSASRPTGAISASAQGAQPPAVVRGGQTSQPLAARSGHANSRRSAPAAEVPADAAGEFIELPTADRLPTFESGTIVRVELPVSSLPAYGLPIMPDAPRTPVTADVIVGQDGQPRAIRLVGFQTGPRRR